MSVEGILTLITSAIPLLILVGLGFAGRYRLFERNGYAGWKGLIPIYNRYVYGLIAEQRTLGIVSAVISVFEGVAGAVVGYVVVMTLVWVFLFVMWLLSLVMIFGAFLDMPTWSEFVIPDWMIGYENIAVVICIVSCVIVTVGFVCKAIIFALVVEKEKRSKGLVVVYVLISWMLAEAILGLSTKKSNMTPSSNGMMGGCNPSGTGSNPVGVLNQSPY